MTPTNKKAFLLQDAPKLLEQLRADTLPAFGLMTPQHMVEHLTRSIKIALKRKGEPEDPPLDRQMGFKRFIAKGAVLRHRPSDKTAADLPPLKYASLEEAISHFPESVERFYTHFESHPEFLFYNPFMGELDFEEIELFTFQHVRYHFWQFGLLESYP
ncbi:MAG: hypothetical protein AAF587_37460 [Bacteroidota bacterium]